MAGRGRIHPALDGGRGPLPGQLLPGPGMIPPVGGALDALPHSALEHKLVAQHAELQRLLSENQRLATTHVALRQELAVTQQEIQRLQQVVAGVQAEKEQQLRALTEKIAKLEADLLAAEPLKVELQKCQADAQNFALHQQELNAQVQQLSQDLKRTLAEAQQVPGYKNDIEALAQEVQRARVAFEYEKKANIELLEQRQVMEKNLVTLAREVEMLRADIAAVEKKGRGYGGYVGGPDSTYPSVQQTRYGDSYGISQIGASAENGVAPAYDVPRARR